MNPSNYIFLNKNESPFDFDLEFKKKVANKIISKSWNRYPKTEDIKKKISEKINVSHENIILTSGSMEAIDIYFYLLLSNKNKYIQLEESYYRYRELSTFLNKEVIHCNEDYDSLYKILNNSEIPLLLCNPNNPTGKKLEKKQIYELASITKSFIFIDSTYSNFFERDNIFDKKNIIQSFSFSKIFSGAGIRAGIIIADKEIVSKITKIKNPFTLNHFSLSFLDEITNPDQWEKCYRNIKAIEFNKDYLIHNIKNKNISITNTFTIFIILREKNNNINKLNDHLIKNNVIAKIIILDENDVIRLTVGKKIEIEHCIKVLNQY